MSFLADTTTDLDTMFDDDGFAVDAIIGAAPVKVIFDEPYEAVSPITGEVDTTAPKCLIRSADATAVVQGTAITIVGVSYTVMDVQPGGQGLTELILSTEAIHG